MTIVGVAAPGFAGVSLGFQPDIYVPVTMKKQVTPSWDDLENRRSRWVEVYARLSPGISRDAAEASLEATNKSSPPRSRSPTSPKSPPIGKISF